MKVTKKKVDDLNLVATISIEPADYADAKKKKLNEFRRTADIKGFRKGMAPLSLIDKIHGGQALAEVINSLINDGLTKFIDDNKLNVIGEPLPHGEDNNDWSNPDKFSFSFDVATAPKFNAAVTDQDKIPYYNITVTAAAVKDYKSNLLKQFGNLETGDAAKDDDFIIVDFEQGENRVEGAYVALRSIQDTDIKKSFIGKKAGDVMDIDVNKTFVNETDRAAMLKVSKEELATMAPEWKMTVKEVKTFVDAPENQDTFDKIFGKDAVGSAEEFDAKVKERLGVEYTQESDYRFMIDAKEYMLNRENIQLPDAFLKRWVFTANDGKFTMEQIEEEYDLFAKDFRWNLIRNEILKDQKLQVTKEALVNEAKQIASYQFAAYGMNNVPDDMIENYANRTLEDQEQARRIYERVEDDLVLNYIRSVATIEKKKISLDKMREMTA